MAEQTAAQRRKDLEAKRTELEAELTKTQEELGEVAQELSAMVTRDVPDFIVEPLPGNVVSPPGHVTYTDPDADGPTRFTLAGPEAMALATLGHVKIVGMATDEEKAARVQAELDYYEEHAERAADVKNFKRQLATASAEGGKS